MLSANRTPLWNWIFSINVNKWSDTVKISTIGCVGCGNMGGAILAGLADSLRDGYAFCGCNRTAERMRPLLEKGVTARADASAVAEDSQMVILAVKPYAAAAVLAKMRPKLGADKVLVSVAAGVSLKSLRQAAGGQCMVVRCMPNTPALVGKGVFAFSFEEGVSPQSKNELMELFGTLGLCLELPEARFTAFSALIGAGPAYVFEMMQGLVQAGVTLGFQHKEARRMVAALFAGSARMAELNPAPLMQLRDEVCSPGGLTIAGVNQLDRAGLPGLLVDAVLAADARGREMES